MKFRIIYLVLLSIILLGMDGGSCTKKEEKTEPEQQPNYYNVRLDIKATTFTCPLGVPAIITDPYLIRFEYYYNNERETIHDQQTENGIAYMTLYRKMYHLIVFYLIVNFLEELCRVKGFALANVI